MNPEVMAQAFFGMFFSYNIAQAIFAGNMALETTIDELVEQFVAAVRSTGLKVETGRFQQYMQVEIHNDGPVTILLDSKK